MVCVNVTGDTVGDEECDANIMPPREVRCNVHIPCPYAWSAGQWAGVSVCECGEGEGKSG